MISNPVEMQQKLMQGFANLGSAMDEDGDEEMGEDGEEDGEEGEEGEEGEPWESDSFDEYEGESEGEEEEENAPMDATHQVAPFPGTDISGGDGGVCKQVIEAAPEGAESPPAGALVQAHYEGFLMSNGVKFDSSIDRGTPFSFHLGAGEVVQAWDVAIATMKRGEIASIW